MNVTPLFIPDCFVSLYGHRARRPLELLHAVRRSLLLCVVETVYALTDPPGLPTDLRKTLQLEHLAATPWRVRVVKLADLAVGLWSLSHAVRARFAPASVDRCGMKHDLRLMSVVAACGFLMACQTVPKSGDAGHSSPTSVPAHVVPLATAPDAGKPVHSDEMKPPVPSLSRAAQLQSEVARTATDGTEWLVSEVAPMEPKPLPGSLWSRIRQGMAVEPLRGAALMRMQIHDAWYRQRPEHLQRVFERARPYLFDIVREVQASGLPMEVALLPAVESAFLPKAVSRARADGLWQFMAPTAQRFALRSNLFLDERRSPAVATRAALRYLSVLRDRYGGDMQLALAAYNCGEGCIDAHIRRAQAKGLPGRFEDLALNSETANYVPRLMALSRLVAEAVDGANLSAADLPELQDSPPVRQLALSRDIDKALAARLAQISLAELEVLNPQFNNPLLVASAGQGLVLPFDKADQFEQALLAHKGPLASWTTRRVARNITVEALARRFGCDVATLRSVNRIAPGHLVLAGSTVLVPRVTQWEDVAEAELHQAVLRTAPAITTLRVKVRKGWGWTEVAREVNRRAGPVTAQDLKGANQKLKLKAGWLQLRVPAPVARLQLVGNSGGASIAGAEDTDASGQPHLELTRDVSQDRVHAIDRAHHAQRFRDFRGYKPKDPPDLHA